MAAADEDHFIPANGEEMNSDDDRAVNAMRMDDSSLGSDRRSEDDTIMTLDDEILENFLRNFSNGDYDNQFRRALGLDRYLPSSVRPTQTSYNKPDNWVERNRIGLEKVTAQLQNCIDSVSRVKRLELNVGHNSYGDELMDNEESIVWREPILDEYWNQLEELIKQQDIVTDIHCIEFGNVEMKKERIAALVDILSIGRANFSSTGVRFINANHCEEGIVWLSKLVDVISQLRTLVIRHNRIDNMESALCLSRSLKSHACIDTLHLAHCDLGSSPEILLVVLQSEIIYINLSNNNIDSLGAVTIAEYLEGDPPIEFIALEHNRLNDDDIILISQALRRNTTLTRLDLDGNNFTSFGVKALITCVFDGSRLNEILESNHTLKELNIFSDQACENSSWETENLNDCIIKLLGLDCKQKITLALQDKDSLLQYLANVPVEVIPEVLAYSQQDDNEHQHKHLNILYSTMRWWNMSLLYSHHKLCSATISDTKRKRDN